MSTGVCQLGQTRWGRDKLEGVGKGGMGERDGREGGGGGGDFA